MLTNTMIYWATGTIGGAFMPYCDVLHAGAPRWIAEAVKQKLGSDQVPAGFALFPKDLSHPPREWAQRFFKVQRWTELPQRRTLRRDGAARGTGTGHTRFLQAAARPSVGGLT